MHECAQDEIWVMIESMKYCLVSAKDTDGSHA